MNPHNDTPDSSFAPALEAIDNLAWRELDEIFHGGQMDAMFAHDEIGLAPISQKSGIFYRHFVPIRSNLITLLANAYRRYTRVGFAHTREAGTHPGQWAWDQLQPAVGVVLEWIRDWYILACDGEIQSVRQAGQIPYVPGQTVSQPDPLTVPPFPPPKSWRAPAWLFQVSIAHVGVGPLKTQHVPATDSEQKLGTAQTRLLLKGARRVFLWELGAAIETVRNEEIAAAGAIPTQGMIEKKRRPNKRKGWNLRLKLYCAIQKALSAKPNLEGMEFCAELDKRHALPLYDWTERGEWQKGLTWKEAWSNSQLRRKIRRVRQEAMKKR